MSNAHLPLSFAAFNHARITHYRRGGFLHFTLSHSHPFSFLFSVGLVFTFRIFSSILLSWKWINFSCQLRNIVNSTKLLLSFTFSKRNFNLFRCSAELNSLHEHQSVNQPARQPTTLDPIIILLFYCYCLFLLLWLRLPWLLLLLELDLRANLMCQLSVNPNQAEHSVLHSTANSIISMNSHSQFIISNT